MCTDKFSAYNWRALDSPALPLAAVDAIPLRMPVSRFSPNSSFSLALTLSLRREVALRCLLQHSVLLCPASLHQIFPLPVTDGPSMLYAEEEDGEKGTGHDGD